MKKFLTIVFCTATLFACNNESQKGKLTVTGELKNAPDQNVYLEELYFSEKPPVILDTAAIKNGKFSISALAPEQGLYRLRLEKNDAPFIFINDAPSINVAADYNQLSLETIVFNSPANHLLRDFITAINTRRKSLEEKAMALQQYPKQVETDSMYIVLKNEVSDSETSYKNYIIQYLDTTSNAIMAMFSLGYTREIEPDKFPALSYKRYSDGLNGICDAHPPNKKIK